MKKNLLTTFFFLGFISIISQLVIIRELVISFYGNEFFIGLSLGFWLFWTAVGSFLLFRFFASVRRLANPIVICLLAIPLFLFLEIYLIRLARSMSVVAGAIPNLAGSVGYAFLVTAPLSLVIGLLFPLLAKLYDSTQESRVKFEPGEKQETLSLSLSKGYIWETVGFLMGGLLFSFWLILMNEIRIVFLVGAVSFGLGFLLIKNILKARIYILAFIGGLICLILIATPLPQKINQKLISLRFPGQEIIESKNTKYGNIAVSQQNKQYNIYESGLIFGSSEKSSFYEIITHLPLLAYPEPRKILVIGGGNGMLFEEILKHKPEKIYYLEIDPNLTEFIQEYIGLPDDSRLNIINEDPRLFIKKTDENFNVILINLPDPSTTLLNRFYTKEFFEMTQDKLTPSGVLALHLTNSPNFLNDKIARRNATIFQTLKANFKNVLVLPEDEILFLASEAELSYDPKILTQRLEERKIETKFVTADYINYRLTNDRVKQGLKILEAQPESLNTDFRPLGYYYNLVYWVDHFQKSMAREFAKLVRIDLVWLLIAVILIFLIIQWLTRKKRLNQLLPYITILPEISLIAIEVLLILGFQMLYGYVYYKVALIITLIVGGMALGSWRGYIEIKKLRNREIKDPEGVRPQAIRRGEQTRPYRASLKKIYLQIALYCFLLPLVLIALQKLSLGFWETSVIFPVLVIWIGYLVGKEFPYINKLYLQDKIQTNKAGTIYGADLFGSAIGAILAGIFLIPILGVVPCLVFLGILNLLGVGMMAKK